MGSGFVTRSVMVPDPVAGSLSSAPTVDRDGQPYLTPLLSLSLTLPLTLIAPTSLVPSSPPALDTSIFTLQPSIPRSFASLAHVSTYQPVNSWF